MCKIMYIKELILHTKNVTITHSNIIHDVHVCIESVLRFCIFLVVHLNCTGCDLK